MADIDDLWIFAYGSLMWRPDFDFVERQKARLAGYHRSLCIFSHLYRGTPTNPGLVLGLDRGGSCVGIGFRIAETHRVATLDAVRTRELVTGVYREVQAPMLLEDGSRVSAVTYVADRAHVQYAGKLPREQMAARIRQCAGSAGPNADYVRNTHLHLQQMGLQDSNLAWIVAAIDHEN
ncbi:gamma-glutamylcyclotransferase [Lichenihabitans psoromatis]|uniref:gamma-glutamylcyclotransferase n=1 Tax=Lichenihabitans psoromatis TaxID=2528642 RepID=UPI0010384675|nr:gamma-glutamylcyclotransferase [Lichenihabitans psoromatis]